MVIRLKQIPRLLEIIKKFEKDKKAKPIISYVEKTFNNSPVEEAIYPDFKELGTFCQNTGILKFENNLIKITPLGHKIFEEFVKKPELNSNIKKLFREQCFLRGTFSNDIQDGLSRFIKNGNDVWAPSDKVIELFNDKVPLPLLYECELLILVGDRVILNLEYSDKISIKKITKQVRLTQNHVDNQLRHMKKIGEIAEELVLNYEKNRLNSLDCKFESNKIQRISLSYANAGYDIVSFNGKTQDGEYDRFIEVKGSSGKDFDFHWSENEIKHAEELKDRYWLYFVPEIDVDKKTSSKDPIMIQNPYSSIFSNSNFDKVIEGYHITKKSNVEL